MSYTTRLTSEERKKIFLPVAWSRKHQGYFEPEVALGSLEERLDIIFRNSGGRTRIVLTKDEKRQLKEARIS